MGVDQNPIVDCAGVEALGPQRSRDQRLDLPCCDPAQRSSLRRPTMGQSAGEIVVVADALLARVRGGHRVPLVIEDLAGQEGVAAAPDAASRDPLRIELRLDGVEHLPESRMASCSAGQMEPL